MSLIEKIDALLDQSPFLTEDMNIGYQNAVRDIKQIILSEQKEPCELCNWFKGMKAPMPEIESKLGEDIIYKSKKINCCPNCGRQLNQPYTE